MPLVSSFAQRCRWSDVDSSGSGIHVCRFQSENDTDDMAKQAKSIPDCNKTNLMKSQLGTSNHFLVNYRIPSGDHVSGIHVIQLESAKRKKGDDTNIPKTGLLQKKTPGTITWIQLKGSDSYSISTLCGHNRSVTSAIDCHPLYSKVKGKRLRVI